MNKFTAEKNRQKLILFRSYKKAYLISSLYN